MSLFMNKNFSILLSGRFLINIIDSIYYISVMWLVYQYTSSTFYTGIAGAVMLIPEAISFLFGPIIDKLNKKKILLISTSIQVILLTLILFLINADSFSIPLLLLIIFLVAIATEFSYPTENALLPLVVPENSLVKANSLFSIARQGTDLLFNSITGFLISIIGIAALFKIDVFLLIVVFIIFCFLKIQKVSEQEVIIDEENYSTKEYLKDLKLGFKFVSNPLVMKVLIPLIFVNFVFSGIYVVFPEISKNFSGGADYYGLLIASLSGGMMFGSILSDRLTSKISIGSLMFYGYSVSGLFWLVFAFFAAESIWISCIALALSGIPIGATNIVYYTLFQVIPEKDMIARLNTLTTSLITVAMPLGSVICGFLAEMFSSELILVMNGVMMIILGANWFILKDLRTMPKISEIDTEDFKNTSI
ncbi:MAG: MFS transporter [Carnobacterium alterfunditum]